jgi:hypothetical protein
MNNPSQEALRQTAWSLVGSADARGTDIAIRGYRSTLRPVKSFSLRLIAIVWLLAALSLVGWLIVNLDTAGWILVAITTGLMAFELTRTPVAHGRTPRSTKSSQRYDEPGD